MLRRLRHSQSFTLLELMVVMIIVSVIASMAVVNYNKTMETIYYNKARHQLIAIHAALMVYWNKKGAYPFEQGQDWEYSLIKTIDDINATLGVAIDDTEFSYLAVPKINGFLVTAIRRKSLTKRYTLIVDEDAITSSNPWCESFFRNCPD